MLEIRIHGRGGQGVVTAAELLSTAAFVDGLWAQSFPSFGSERMGAPVTAYCRIDDHPIRTHEPITRPQGLIVVDATLLGHPDVVAGVRPRAWMLVNTSRQPSDLRMGALLGSDEIPEITTLPATELARRRLNRPFPNAVLLGAFAALTGAVGLPAVLAAIQRRFPGPLGTANAIAAQDGFAAIVERTGVVRPNSPLLTPPSPPAHA